MRRSKGIQYNDLSDALKRLNPRLAPQNDAGSTKQPAPVSTDRAKGKTQGRPVSESERGIPKMNKTEARFLEIIKRDYKGALIVPQPTRFFRFPNGDTYTPDFLVIDGDGVFVFEVKGGYRGPGWQQGYERYHRAKERFESYDNRIVFELVPWDAKRGEWSYE